jgi:hypothetical protein
VFPADKTLLQLTLGDMIRRHIRRSNLFSLPLRERALPDRRPNSLSAPSFARHGSTRLRGRAPETPRPMIQSPATASVITKIRIKSASRRFLVTLLPSQASSVVS